MEKQNSNTQAEADKVARLTEKVKNLESVLKGADEALKVVEKSMSLVGSSSKELAKVQQKLKTALEITNSMQQVSNVLKKDGFVQTGIVGKATSMWAGAVDILNTRLGISIGLSKALVGGGIGLLIAGISLIVSKYQSWKKEQEEINRLNSIAPERMKAATEEGAKSAAKQVASLDLLYKASQNSSKSMDERKKAIEELQNTYPSYFGNLSQEEILAGKGASAYDGLKKSIIASAMARAYADSIAENSIKIAELETKKREKEKEKAEIEEKRDKAAPKPDKGSFTSMYMGGAGVDVNSKKQYQQLNTQANALKKELSAIDKEIKKYQESNEDLEKRIDVSALLKTHDSLPPKSQKQATENKPVPTEVKPVVNEGNKGKEEEAFKAQLESMRNYLKEYGTFHEKKLAIAEEYAEKIKKAEGNEGEKKRLVKQEQAALAAVDVAAIKANVDWTVVFGEFGAMFEDVLKTKLNAAEKYAKTEEFKNATPETQKDLNNLIDQMKKALTGSGGINFKKLGQEVKEYQESLQDLNLATEVEADAKNKLTKATADYNAVLKSGTEEEKKSAEEALENARKNAEAASENVKAQTDIVGENQKAVTSTATNLKKNMDDVTQGMSKLASGGLKNAYDGFIQMAKGMGGPMENVAKSLEEVPIIGWIVSIIDILKDGLSNLIGGLLDTIFNAVSGIISDILSGDVFITIGKSLRDGIKNVFDAISFGGFSSLVDSINGSNAKEVAETTNRLTASNTVLKQSIDALKDEMQKAKGIETVNVYEDAVAKQKEVISNTGQILAAKMSYSGSHHSNNYYIGKSMSKDDWNKISGKVGKRVSNVHELWNLSPEDLKKVSTLTDVWNKIYNGGKYSERMRPFLEGYLDLAGTLEELENQLNQTLTQTTFDNVYSSFVDTLMDMNASAEDFADNVSEYFMRAMLSNMIGSKYSSALEGWYKKFADKMKDGTLSESERNQLKDEYMGYVNSAIRERDELAKTIGYGEKKAEESTQQGATRKGFEAMSQDTAEELNGRFTALQMSGEEMKNHLNAILMAETEQIGIADETRSIIVNSYLELQSISENTGAIVKPINNMSEKLDHIERKIQTL